MTGDELTASECAILLALMAEARAVLNTELVERYGIDVEKPRRDKLNRLQLVRSVKAGRTYSHELDDKGWVRVQEDLQVSSPRARAVGGALAALHLHLRERVLPRTGFRSLGELFSRGDLPPARAPGDLHVRVRHAYAALASEPGAWVALVRLRPFFADVPRADLDEALRELVRTGDADLVPENNQKSLTDADRAAAVHMGGQDKHLLAIGV